MFPQIERVPHITYMEVITLRSHNQAVRIGRVTFYYHNQIPRGCMESTRDL